MSSVVSPEPATGAPGHAAPPAGHCLNCHQRLAGPFCHHCGQAAKTPARITGHYLLHELPHTIWHVDHGIVYTVREMLLRPGLSIQRYLAGERKPFFSPISLLILVGGIGAFMYSKLGIDMFSDPAAGLSPAVHHTQQQIGQIVQKYQGWVSLLLLPLSAAIAAPLLRRRTGYTWAEQLVAASLLSSTVAIVGLVAIPMMAFSNSADGVGRVVLGLTVWMLAYKTFGYAQLLAACATPALPYPPVRRWLRSLTVSLLEYLATMLVFALVLLTTLLLRHH